jgi:hypothetical protein
VIDFGDRSEEESATYVLPFARVVDQVKLERMRNNRKVYRDYWWQYAEKRPAMRQGIAQLSEVLVIARISKTVMPLRLATGPVMNEKTVVFTSADYGDQALLSSSLHWLWTVKYTSTMRTDINYAPSDVFLTFPRPEPNGRLTALGQTLDDERREIMLRRQLGLTSVYNLVNDPKTADQSDADIARLRHIHKELDKAVMAAFGWEDILLDHGFHTYRQMTRWTVSPAARAEVLDRLLEENHRRYALQADDVPIATSTDENSEVVNE